MISIFRGFLKSNIYFDGSKWVLQSLVNSNMSVITFGKWPDKVPIGRFKWTLQFDNAVCEKLDNEVIELTLSKCFQDQFTCSSGDCLPIR